MSTRLDPLARFRAWLEAAERGGIPLADASALATASRSGRPSVRFVLVKQIDPRGIVFFTDGRSRKGRDLHANPRAALVCYWHAQGRQARAEGRIVPVSAAEADAYWETRPRASRIAACASYQDAPIASRERLIARWKALARRYRGHTIPRPPYWRGYRLVPDQVEFWIRGAHRLHRRELFTRAGRGWRRQLLQP